MIEIPIVPGQLTVDGKSLETFFWKIAGARETIVLIHEALGSASYWKSFPAELARRTHCHVVAYSRAGHGNSDGPLMPRSASYYEYQVDAVLPALIQRFKIAEPVLYGHSEGAAIAFLYAAKENSVKAIIAESPIVAAEDGTMRAVDQINRPETRDELIGKLGKYHLDADAVFHSWVDSVRFHPVREFPSSSYLPRIQCPVLVIQGALDPYGSAAQSTALEDGIPHLRRVVLAEAGHLPHREQTEAVLENVARFLTQLPRMSEEAPAGPGLGTAPEQ